MSNEIKTLMSAAIKAIKTEHDYNSALARIDELMDSTSTSESSDCNELDVLVQLVEAYENKNFSI
jgi:antitoxin component HigA of HigAB toxin-antitoxin module